MSNSAIDVVIGLVFIYLLYSLLATVLAEMIATCIGLRARNLKEAVNRMLTDEEEDEQHTKWYVTIWGGLCRLFDSFNLIKTPKNPIVDKFYNNPEIKYLGSTGLFKNPSSFKAESFSRTLLYELNGSGELDKQNIESELKNLAKPKATEPDQADSVANVNPPNKGVSNNKIRTLDYQTAEYVLSLYHSSYGDLTKFKLLLEAWFDRTMEQALEWYKRKIQLILLVIGFFMAWFFNADTFVIAKKLSVDKDAREKLVTMATAYVQNNKDQIDTISTMTNPDSTQKQAAAKIDSLLDIKKKLDADIESANSLLGLGGWLPDSVKVIVDPKTRQTRYAPEIEPAYLKVGKKPVKGYLKFNACERWGYLFGLLFPHFFGFLITAIAISLGAPFWFDLLNKLMKLRTSTKQDTNSTTQTISGKISVADREA